MFVHPLGEARKQFKIYVNVLSTIKNENNEKYLILRKRYCDENPIEHDQNDLNLMGNAELLRSPGSRSGISEHDLGASERFLNEFQNKSIDSSPYKEPPPYKPPPKVPAYQQQEKYGECVDEFRSALFAIGSPQNSTELSTSAAEKIDTFVKLPQKLKSSKHQMIDLQVKMPNKTIVIEDKENVSESLKISYESDTERTLEKQISVKEATKKFNRIASEEEASKIISPTSKNRAEKVSY